MQASSLSILVDEKRVNDLLKQKTGAKAFLRSACNLLAFIFFISLFTAMALSEPLALHRSFEAYVRHRFDYGAAMRLDEVNSMADFYQYWNVSVIPGLYSNDSRQYTFPGAQIPKMLKIDGDKANNRLFGLARVRMQKVVKGTDCRVQSSLEASFPNCYGGFIPEAEDKEDFGPISVIGGAMFRYHADATGKPHLGQLAEYPAGGFSEVMYGNYSQSLELISTLRENHWLSPASRAIWFEFTIYNLNLGLYAVCRMTFEISPVGGWLKKLDIDILDQRHLKPLGDKGLYAWILLIMEAVLVIFVVRYLCEEASEFIACDGGKGRNPLKRMRIKWDYFTDGWNIIDWMNLILMIMCMMFRFANWSISQSKEVIIGTNLDVSMYTDLHDVVGNVRTIRQLTAFNAVLTWFKAVKYINILPYIGTFMETMALSWQYLVGFAAIFVTSFMGFCLSYCTAFGESISDFRTVPRSFVFLMRAFVGNADFRLVYDANPVIGSLLLVMFVISMIFVNLNLFCAILISYMSDARQTQEMQQKKEWAKFSDKIMGFGETVARVTQMQARFRGCFPGLWSRMRTWERNAMALERKRDERLAMRAKMSMPHEHIENDLGSASPSHGRRKKRAYKQELDDDNDDASAHSDTESEPDLGPLRFKEQLEPQHQFDWDEHHHDMMHGHHHGHHMLEDEHGHHDHHGHHPPQPPPGMGIPGFTYQEEEVDRDEEAKELVLEATEHVVQTIKDRCKGARNLVVGEMGEARQVLQGIGNVLEVLGRRARSLEAQQEQILPPEVLARVKAEAEEEEENFFQW